MTAPESLRDEVAAVLAEAVQSVEIRELARKAVEDELIEFRDAGLSMPFRNNGCVVKYRDGSSSDIIRFGPEVAVSVGVRAVAHHLADALLASPAIAQLQSRLDAITAYAGHPGNSGAGDTRGRLIHDLATGAVDPSSRDWSNTNLPTRDGGA